MSIGVSAEGGGIRAIHVSDWLSPQGARCELVREGNIYRMRRTNRNGEWITTHVTTADQLAALITHLESRRWEKVGS